MQPPPIRPQRGFSRPCQRRTAASGALPCSQKIKRPSKAVEYLEPMPYEIFHLFNGFLRPLRYDIRIDSCTTLPAMYVGVSERRLARSDIPVRNYRL